MPISTTYLCNATLSIVESNMSFEHGDRFFFSMELLVPFLFLLDVFTTLTPYM